jgi:plastocyanin
VNIRRDTGILLGAAAALLLLGAPGPPPPAADTCAVYGSVKVAGRTATPLIVYETDPHGPVPTAPIYAEVGQVNKQFTTPAVVVSRGAEVTFPNSDTVNHHLYSHSGHDPFSLPEHVPGSRPARVFDVPGDSSVQCNIHRDMEAHVMVLPNAWWDEIEDDQYQITGLTPGRHTIRAWGAWQRAGGPRGVDGERTFDCAAGQVVRIDLALKSRSVPTYP